MSPVTTESGQARSDLIALFEEAQGVAGAERERASGYRAAIRKAVTDSTVQEQGDQVHLEMPGGTWQALREIAADES
jgi:hypothetical protein